MTEAIVLGAGLVGGVIAADLAADPEFRVTVADRSQEALARTAAHAERFGGRIGTVVADLADEEVLQELVAPYDIVLGALASHLGFGALRAVITAKKSYCDISFMAQDAWELDALAAANGVTAAVDFGVAPGMSNVLAGHAVALLDECRSIAIYVGGLPAEPRWPFHFKAAFAPSDVIEEYVRAARLVEHGELVVRPALSEPEFLDFARVGTLEAFNTDGLRSLAHTLKVPFMKEKTLRYPEHAQLMRALDAAGFFSSERVRAGDALVRPVDLTAALLVPQWTYTEGEEDLTVLRVVAEGRRDGKQVHLAWDLFDRYDPITKTTSMARTTAFPCALMAREIASGRFAHPGVVTPELVVGTEGLVERIFAGLEARGVRFTHTER